MENQFHNISRLARIIDESRNAEETYQFLTQGVCAHSKWDISSIQVLDADASLAIPIARYDPETAGDLASIPGWDAKHSPVGQVLEQGEPLIIRDAADQDDFPGFRKDARNRGYHTTVMIPLDVRDAGKRSMVYSVASRSIVDVDAEDLGFLECVAELTNIAIKKIRKLAEERCEADRLKSILENMTASLDKTLDSEASEPLAEGLSGLFPSGWLAVDLTSGRGLFDPTVPPPVQLATARRMPDELIRAALDARKQSSEDLVTLRLQNGDVRAEVSALQIDGSHVGTLFFFRKDPLSDHERIAAQAGRLALSSYILRSFIEFRSRRVTARRLLSRLLSGDWRDLEEVLDEAHVLNFDLQSTMQLLVLRLPEARLTDEGAHSFVQRSAQATFGSAISCFLDGDLVMLTSGVSGEVQRLQNAFLSRIKTVVPDGFQIVMSSETDAIEDLPKAWQICKNTLDVATAMKLSGWITPEKMGGFSHLMASADLTKAQTFLDNVIPQALLGNSRKAEVARKTLEVFLGSGRRYQEAADTLGIHVSTLRYRLEQLSDQNELNFSDSDKCFELDLALRLLKLKNSYVL